MANLYRLSNDGKPGGPPVVVGSPLRVPSQGFVNWGIEGLEEEIHPLTLTQYFAEFGDTTPAWMGYVKEASTKSGIGDRPGMLQTENARVSAHLTTEAANSSTGRVYVVDLCAGAGGSAKPYLDRLVESGFDLNRLHLTVVDLSPGKVVALEGRREEFATLGLKYYRIVHARDVDLPAHLEEGSQDLVFSVAGIHANGRLRPSLAAINRVLNGNGALVTTDWHTVRWLCPCYTYALLDAIPPQEYDWTTKDADMDEFRRMFSAASHANGDPFGYHRDSEHDVTGAKELERFWHAWMDIRRDAGRLGAPIAPNDELVLLEGHRPYQMYVDEMKKSGFRVDGEDPLVSEGVLKANPWQILPDSSLHAVTVARSIA